MLHLKVSRLLLLPGIQLAADAFVFRHDTKGIFPENFLYVTLGVAFLQQGFGDLREFRGVFHAVGHIGAVEVRTEAHVIDAGNFHGMVDVLEDFAEFHAREFALLDVFAGDAVALDKLAAFVVRAPFHNLGADGLVQLRIGLFRDAEKADPELNKAISAEVMKRCADNEGCQLIEGDRITREYVEQGKLPRVEFGKILEHIDHAVKVAGIDHVGLGSDFDGANMPYGMEDATKLPKITEALLQKGYTEGDVKKILGENTLRVMTEVEVVSRERNARK